jgi:CheY-like chemotaxis protein
MLASALVQEAARRGAILVVEDRDDVRQGLAQLLELHGFLVSDARTGEDALRQLSDDPEGFALMLLDLVLPGTISGGELRRRQLAEPALRAIPTIIVTASDLEPESRRALQPDAWVDKPYYFDQLLDVIRRYVVSEGSALSGEGSPS